MKKTIIIMLLIAVLLPSYVFSAKLPQPIRTLINSYNNGEIPKNFSSNAYVNLNNKSVKITKSTGNQKLDGMLSNVIKDFISKPMLVSTLKFVGVSSPLYFFTRVNAQKTVFGVRWDVSSPKIASLLAKTYKKVLKKFFSKSNSLKSVMVDSFSSYSKGKTVYTSWSVSTKFALSL